MKRLITVAITSIALLIPFAGTALAGECALLRPWC